MLTGFFPAHVLCATQQFLDFGLFLHYLKRSERKPNRNRNPKELGGSPAAQGGGQAVLGVF
jgi:hypothetical protein